MIRRFVWFNNRRLFRRPESRTGKEIFSMFHKDVPFVVYERDFWWSDSWDPLTYGRDYSFGRPFFEQLGEMIKTVPWPSRSLTNAVNADYVNNCTDVKNSYLCFGGSFLENSAYVVFFRNVKEGFDLYESRHSELCYDSYMVDESFRVFFSVNCEESTDVWFSKNLFGCTNCFGSVNLRKKSYQIFNKQVTKEEYKEFMDKFRSGSYQAVRDMKDKVHDLWMKFPNRFTLAIKITDSTGEHIEQTKNVHESYDIHEGENLKYCQFLTKSTDSYDHTRPGAPSSFIYEGLVVGLEAERVKFSAYCFAGVNDLEYCVYCPGSSNLFGCVGLRKKQYCIFNKQYTKEEYFALREKIISHMREMPYTDKQGKVYTYGEFFPSEFSPFAANESLIADYTSLTKEDMLREGFIWRDPETREHAITLETKDIPDMITDVKDDILKEVIGCASCGKAYRIIPAELAFYKKILLPIPRLCPDCRFTERFGFTNPPKLWSAKCQCTGKKDEKDIYTNNTYHFHGEVHCPTEFKTSYKPGSKAIIYCEQCYQTEVA